MADFIGWWHRLDMDNLVSAASSHAPLLAASQRPFSLYMQLFTEYTRPRKYLTRDRGNNIYFVLGSVGLGIVLFPFQL